MPINVHELDKIPENRPKTDRKITEELLQFFQSNKDKAYTAKELSVLLDIDFAYVRHLLSVLKGKRLLKNKKPYWYIERINL